MNARIEKALEGEEEYVGNTLGQQNTNVEYQSDEVRDNRDRLMEFCTQNDMKIMNTMFCKQDKHKTTYKENKRENDGLLTQDPTMRY